MEADLERVEGEMVPPETLSQAEIAAAWCTQKLVSQGLSVSPTGLAEQFSDGVLMAKILLVVQPHAVMIRFPTVACRYSLQRLQMR